MALVEERQAALGKTVLLAVAVLAVAVLVVATRAAVEPAEPVLVASPMEQTVH